MLKEACSKEVNKTPEGRIKIRDVIVALCLVTAGLLFEQLFLNDREKIVTVELP